MDKIQIINAGLRMFKRNLNVRIKGLPKYKGNAEEVCYKIIDKCWNEKKQYFKTSKDNYTEFYCRDFGMVTKALIYLNFKEKVKKTLEFALINFKKCNRITVMISKKGKCFDFPYYAPDSLAFLLHSINELNDKSLIKKYKKFLENQIYLFEKKVVQKNGLPKEGKFSSMRDFSIRENSCYDLCMIYMVQKYSKKLKLYNNLQKFNYKNLILKYYWSGNYFKDNLKTNHFSSDANVLPYWTELIKDKIYFNNSLKYIIKNNLDKPLPLMYSNNKNEKMHWLEFLVPNWERNKIWIHLGYLYIESVYKFNKKLAFKYIEDYKKNIERYKNQLEIFENNEKPYKSLFYYCSDSMIWAANYLWLKK
jgi:hypothetical protein